MEGYAMSETKGSTDRSQVVEFRRNIQEMLQGRLTEAIEALLGEELDGLLGSSWYERSEQRRGYRNGTIRRRVTTPAGTRELKVPRARLKTSAGRTREFRSELLPRYARRTRQIDEAILGVYLSGANSRRIRKALEPLLGEENLSRSAVSRVVARLKGLFEKWTSRDLSAERYSVVFLDGFHLKVRMARRVVAVPVLAALGVGESGQKVLLALQLAPSESSGQWGHLIEDLQRRGLAAPLLVVIDGGAGLNKALANWKEVKVQRCVVHKLRNLQDHCPAHARAEMTRDYSKIVYARDGLAARESHDAFVKKWSALCPAVARSLEEAGAELLTFYEFPRSTWKSLRTTNALENLNREFRRRTKTQASFPTEEAALRLLYGLVAFDQINLRKVDGYRDLAKLMEQASSVAA
jgi:transposase-like protein